jgi:predicted AlkP superfamily pyrophosphatase or phosphodiesterase
LLAVKMNSNNRSRRAITLAVFLAAIVLAATGQSKITDLRPTVILVSVDGFRYDYLEKYRPPTLRSLARDGVQAKWMIPSFPSKTFPNHYTIVTGLYPQNNGIVENSVYDRKTGVTFSMSNREAVRDGRWWLGEPIWVTAEKQGQKAAPFFWPGSEAQISGKWATYWKPYDGKVTDDARVELILSSLDMPASKRPTFLTLYFSDVDTAGHDYSPDSPETRAAVLKVDRELRRLIDGLKKRGIFRQVNLIIVSDHGMTTQDPKNTIVLDELFDTKLAEKVLWTAEIVSIFPKEGNEDRIYESLKDKLPSHAKVYRKPDVPARLHYSDSPRIAPLLVFPEEGWTLTTLERLKRDQARGRANRMRGGHGYDNALTSMRAIFIAHGLAFKKSVVIEPFENVQVYNVMAKILGLKPAPNDGNDSVVSAALVNNTWR